VIADPFVQLRLLDLQAVDTALAQLRHRRQTLPELAAIADCERRADEARAQLVEAETSVSDLDAEQRRLEADVDTVRKRADKDQATMTAGGTSAKQVSSLQHEVESLARRQSVLEDELIELMEQRETAEAAVTRLSAEAAAVAEQQRAAETARDAALADIDAAQARRDVERAELAGRLPADLLALYDKVRGSNAGVGAAMLRHRRCEGCRLELAGSELSRVRTAKPDEVLRCDNCRCILVRTDESGL